MDGAIGAIFGAIGGKCNGSKHLTNLGKQTINRTFNATKHKGVKEGFKESIKAFSYYGKSTASYYKSTYSKVNLFKNVSNTIASQVASSEYMKSQYYRVFGG